MEIGKIPAQLLEKMILNPIRNDQGKRTEVKIRPKTGEDCSAVDMGEELCVISTDPITGATKDAGYLAVHINCNDIAASGAEPVGILLTALLPEGSDEMLLKELMDGVRRASKEIGIEILGGHTEVTSAVNRPVISGTVLGKTRNRHFISSGGAQEGQGVIMTKWAGLEGTCILATEQEKELSERLGTELVEKAKKMNGFLSVVKEGMIAAKFGATAMHDATEGGILGAVWEVADCSGTGIEIDLQKIPVKEETWQICQCMGIDPYRLISSGTMIITTFDAEKLVRQLIESGIEAAVIGRITRGEKLLLYDGKKEPLESPESDELYQAKFGKDIN